MTRAPRPPAPYVCRERAETARSRPTALLCPGQGAYLPGAFARLRQLPHVRAVLTAVDATRSNSTFPVTWLLNDPHAPTPAHLLQHDPLAFDLATYAGVVASGQALIHHFGHPIHAVAGHSVGDIAALAICGAISPTDGAQLLHTRHHLLSVAPLPPAGLLAVAMPASQVAALLATAGLLRVRIAADNAPQQTVVAGTDRELTIAAGLFRGMHRKTKLLPSRTSFHHPRLTDIANTLRTELMRLPVQQPIVALYSSTQARQLTTAADIRYSPLQHLTEPVHFPQLLRALEHTGIRSFIDTGPRAILSPLVKANQPTARTTAPLRTPCGPQRIQQNLARFTDTN